MTTLTAATHVLRVVTGAAANITSHFDAFDVDAAEAVTVPEVPNVVITTATTTTVVGSPAAGKQRTVNKGALTNSHASASCNVKAEHFDGTNGAWLAQATLLPGESLRLLESGEWQHVDAQGGAYEASAPPSVNLGVTGTIAETVRRQDCAETNTAVGASGTLFMNAIQLLAGQTISTIDLWSATTAAGTPTQYNVGLYDANRNLVAQGTNKTTEAWAANSQKSFALTAAYKVPTSGLYYIGFYMVATTVPTLKGNTAKTGGQLAAAAPALHGTSSTGLTTTLPNPAAAITGGTASIYAAAR